MAKKKAGFQAWPYKFKTGLTMPSRLGKYKHPLPMVGNPYSRNWANNASMVYSEMMVIKRGGWRDRTWNEAWDNNRHLEYLISRKWDDYEIAWRDNIADYLIPEAELDNFNFDYHHEYAPNVSDWIEFANA